MVILVDDHRFFAEGLQYILRIHGIEVKRLAQNGLETLQKARVLKPDIILMDISMPRCDGLQALKLIKAEMPEIKVVMLTTSEEDENLFRAVKLGASGYLLKSLKAEELVNMIQDLQNGEVPLSPGLAEKLLREFGLLLIFRVWPCCPFRPPVFLPLFLR